jgi:hypothetical protein
VVRHMLCKIHQHGIVGSIPIISNFCREDQGPEDVGIVVLGSVGVADEPGESGSMRGSASVRVAAVAVDGHLPIVLASSAAASKELARSYCWRGCAPLWRRVVVKLGRGGPLAAARHRRILANFMFGAPAASYVNSLTCVWQVGQRY